MYTEIQRSASSAWALNWPIKRPMFLVGALALASTAAALRLPDWVAVLPLVALAVSLCLRRLRQPLWWFSWGAVALFWLIAVGYRALLVCPLAVLEGQEVTLSGWVEEVPASGDWYTLRVTEGEGIPANCRVKLYVPDLAAPVRYETITAEVTLSAVPADRGDLLADGIRLTAMPTGYGQEALTITGRQARLPLFHCLQPWRQRLVTLLRQHLPGEEGASLAAICLGERSGLSAGIQEAFRASGLSHLLVVSGLHLSMVVLTVWQLLRRCGTSPRIAAVGSMAAVILFMFIVGFTPSVSRAGTMCMVWLFGLLFRRRGDGLNSLGLAAALILLYNPYSLWDVGFQLSFGTTAGVLVFTPRLTALWCRRGDPAAPWYRRAVETLYNGVMTGLGACLGALLVTLPLSAWYFGQISLTAPLSNVLAVGAGGVGLTCGWMGMLLCLLPGGVLLGRLALLVAGLVTKYVLWIASWCAAPVTVTATWQFVLLAGGCLLLMGSLLWLKRSTRIRLLAGLLATLLVAVAVDQGVPDRCRITLQAEEEEYLLYLEQPEGSALVISHSGMLSRALSLLEKRGCRRLDFLMIAQGETSHVGWAAALLQQVPADRVYAEGLWLTGTAITSLPLQTISAGAFTLEKASSAGWYLRQERDTLLVWQSAAPPPTADVVVLVGDQRATLPEESHYVYLTDSSPITLTARPTGEWSVSLWQ